MTRAFGRLVALGAVLLSATGCVANGVPCVEVTHTKKVYPETWPHTGSPMIVYDSSYKRCGEGVK